MGVILRLSSASRFAPFSTRVFMTRALPKEQLNTQRNCIFHFHKLNHKFIVIYHFLQPNAGVSFYLRPLHLHSLYFELEAGLYSSDLNKREKHFMELDFHSNEFYLSFFVVDSVPHMDTYQIERLYGVASF